MGCRQLQCSAHSICKASLPVAAVQRGSGSAASPTGSQDLRGNVSGAGRWPLHHPPGLNHSAVLNSHT